MIHILYHANCCDGFAAACLAYHAHQGKAQLHPVTYEKPMPISRENMHPGLDTVIFVDFTPPETWLSEMTDHPSRISPANCIIIDHHKPKAAVHEANQSLFTSVFDPSLSGAALTWWHFIAPNLPVHTQMPFVLELLAHYDLGGVWNSPHLQLTNEARWLVSYLMRAIPRTRQAWLPFLLKYDTPGTQHRRVAQEIGAKLFAADQRIIRGLVKGCQWVNISGFEVPALNGIPYNLLNDALHELLNEHPDAHFAAAWNVLSDPGTGGVIKWSLRSRKNGFDCASLCHALDTTGGGHHNAAGFASTEPVQFV